MRGNAKGAARWLSRGLALAVPGLVLGVAACSDDPTDPGDDNGHIDDAGAFEIETRGDANALVARWTPADGWTDGDGNAIDRLEAPLDVGGQLEPLQAGGANASLTVRVFDGEGNEIDMETVSRDDDTGERTCSAWSVRWRPQGGMTGPQADEASRVFAFPNLDHPDGQIQHPQDDAGQFAYKHTGEIVGLFHCDHIHFYPEQEGEVDIEFLLWHGDHQDDFTDPITVPVEAPEEPARLELETRGDQNATIGVWEDGAGWTDAEGNAIDELAEPIDAGTHLAPLEAGGANASLTVRYFPYGGDEEANFETLSRDDDTGERFCSYTQGRFAVTDGSDALGWPPASHPDDPDSEEQFVEDADGNTQGIFHCDHIHFYPVEAGEADVEITAIAGDRNAGHFDLHVSDPITVPVHDGD